MSKELKVWKKVFESDLPYVVSELKEELNNPSVLILSGPVGSGKTTLVRYFVGKEAQSPSYSVVNDYSTILHADFYRLTNEEEIIHLELPLYVEGKSVILIEWGKAHLYAIQRELGMDMTYYELEISLVPQSHPEIPAPRNYLLTQLELL